MGISGKGFGLEDLDGQSVPLDGGVASDVHIVDAPEGRIVVKRALAKLRVTADWFSDPARSATEVAAIDAFAGLIGRENVPDIIWVKPEQNCFAMRLVDPRFRNWKKDLLAGHLDLATAGRAGYLLGLAHARSIEDRDLRERFGDWTYFNELRIDPFFLRVADRMPSEREAIMAIVSAMQDRRSALVHGDFSPKNILVDGGEIVVLDFEVAHWGDPHFDVAFCISHLVLKGLRRRADPASFARMAEAFLAAYRQSGMAVDDRHLARLVGCLMLARFEGSSPVDYVGEIERDPAVAGAAALLHREALTVDIVLARALRFSE